MTTQEHNDPEQEWERSSSAPAVYVSEEIDVFFGREAEERLRTRNDLRYLTADGIVAVDKERWQTAQRYERRTWMERSLSESDDRNFEHASRFDNYQALEGRAFSNVIELGCGPFTNLRLILPHLGAVGKVTLLDPLIGEYVHHPHCSYKDGRLGAHAVQLAASSIEEFAPSDGDAYDLVVMNNVLEHCFDIPRIFTALKSMMMNGCVFVFADVAFEESEVKRMAAAHYDAGHPIRLAENYIEHFLRGHFRTLYERRYEGLYEQPQRKDIYFIGEYLRGSVSPGSTAGAAVCMRPSAVAALHEADARMNDTGAVLHFVYAGDPRDDQTIIAPGTITNHLFRFFEKRMPVRYYNLDDETTPVHVGERDIIIGHPHPKEGTALKRLFAQPAAAKVLLWPFHSALPEINRYAFELAGQADRLLMLSGPFWTDHIEETEFGRWKDKITRLDNAVDPEVFRLKKERFNASGARGFFVLGRSGKEKGTRELFRLLAQTEHRAIIAGDYAEEDLAILRGKKNLRTIGRISWNDAETVVMIMAECDFFLNLSVSDASPTALFEAMALGLIPVTTPQCGYSYPSFIMLQGGNNAALDLTMLQHAQHLSDEYLKTMQHANRQLIEERHNWRVLTERVWQALTHVPACRADGAGGQKKMIVAGEAAREMDLTKIDDHSAFASEISAIFSAHRPRKIIETGTYLGTGTTAIIASALKACAIDDAEFYSIEIDPEHCRQASRNLQEAGLSERVVLLNGVSVPRHLLPSYDEIERATVSGAMATEEIYVDHAEADRARLYFKETDFRTVPDDLLGSCLKKFGNKPDFVLLDSAGHMGLVEFTYLISQLRGDCFIALDDTRHIKHYRSLQAMQRDPRFTLLVSSEEKFGFCLARFTYDAAAAPAEPQRARAAEAEKETINCPLCASPRCTIVHAPDIVRCTECSFVYLRERPTRQWMEQYYKTIYAVNDPGAAVTVSVPRDVGLLDVKPEYIAAQRRELFEEASSYYGKPVDGGTIIDIGCGWGALLYNARRCGMQAIGFELTDHNVHFARTVLGLDVRQEQFTEALLAPGSADLVTMSHVLEHVPDPVALVRKIALVLKPGGIFYCVVPNFGSLCSAALGEQWQWLDRTWHYSHFTAETLGRVFEQAGLRIEKLTTLSGDYGTEMPLKILQAKYPGRSPEQLAHLLGELNKRNYGEEIRIVGRKAAAIEAAHSAPRKNLLWIRSDAIGDNILASSMLGPIKEAHPGCALTVVCQDVVRPLYEACPHVERIISFDMRRLFADTAYQEQIAGQLRALGAEKAFNSIYSRDHVSDFLALNTCAKERIALEGDLSNISAEQRASNDRYYTKIIRTAPVPRHELERHREFLSGLGITPPQELRPTIWLTEEDRAYADRVFSSHGLRAGRTLALFAGAQHEVRLYPDYGKALALFCARHDYDVIVLGSPKDVAINSVNMRELQHCLRADLTGKTTLRQSAALLARCAAAIGAETGLAHMACAVGTPNLILLGGGHFGRFMPYSALTTVVALPLECFGCNWRCRFGTTSCVKDVDHRVIAEALEAMFEKKPGERLLFLQASYRYGFVGGLPKTAAVDHLLEGRFAIRMIDPFVQTAPPLALDALCARVQDEDIKETLTILHELFARNEKEIGLYAAHERALLPHAGTLRAALAQMMEGTTESGAFFEYVMALVCEEEHDEERSYEHLLCSLRRQKNPRALWKLAEAAEELALPAYPIFLYQELLAEGVATDELKKRAKMVLDLMAVKAVNKLTPVSSSSLAVPALPRASRTQRASGRGSDAPTVSFVLPSKHRAQGLAAFLESIKAACFGLRYEVLLYAGADTDDAYQALIASQHIDTVFTDSEIFDAGESFSWTKLMNHGFRHARGKWIMYASDDIVLHPLSVAFALECAEGRKKVGGISFLHRNTIQDYDGYFKEYGFDHYGSRPFINFGLISKAAFTAVNGFDERLAFYAGDTDLCWRIVEAGYEILPSYFSLVEHINIEDRTKVANSGATYRRDMQAFNRKWMPVIGRFSDKAVVRERFTLTDAMKVKRHIAEASRVLSIGLEAIQAHDPDYREQQESSAPGAQPEERAIRVSAIVSAYNAERFMRRCLDDLMAQTLYRSGELEIIVIDSGSEEGESEIVGEYQQHFPNIILERTCRETIYAAWNRGVARARGRYLTNANTDDRHRPAAFEIMADILDRNDRIGVVYADVDKTLVPNDSFSSKTQKTPIRWMEYDADLLLFGCYIGPQPMWRRSLHERYGLFDASLKVVGDYEFWLRLSRSVVFHHHSETLGLYYFSPHSAEHRDRDEAAREDEAVREHYLVRHITSAEDVRRIEAKLELIGRHPELKAYHDRACALLRLRQQALQIEQEIDRAVAPRAAAGNATVCAADRSSIGEAEALIEEGETARARAIIEALLAVHPEHIDALNDLSVLEIMEQRWMEAAVLINKVISLEPANESARQNLEYLAHATTLPGSRN